MTIEMYRDSVLGHFGLSGLTWEQESMVKVIWTLHEKRQKTEAVKNGIARQKAVGVAQSSSTAADEPWKPTEKPGRRIPGDNIHPSPDPSVQSGQGDSVGETWRRRAHSQVIAHLQHFLRSGKEKPPGRGGQDYGDSGSKNETKDENEDDNGGKMSFFTPTVKGAPLNAHRQRESEKLNDPQGNIAQLRRESTLWVPTARQQQNEQHTTGKTYTVNGKQVRVSKARRD